MLDKFQTRQSQPLHALELHQVAKMLRAGSVTSAAVTDSLLYRITATYPHLNAFITLCADDARAQAREADKVLAQGRVLGPLHGVPVALKDIFDVVGVATTAAMPSRQTAKAAQDATIVKRLKAAGAVTLGKLNMCEGVYAEHVDPYGPPVNPWDDTLWPGASSSGGGVAVAADLCYSAVASDTGGSIRLPTAANGVTGLKPTWGRVSRHGVFELAATLDHIGPIARSAIDCGMMMGVMAGLDQDDPTTSAHPVPEFPSAPQDGDLRGLRIGLDDAWLRKDVDPQTTARVLDALTTLQSLGAEVVEITFPDPTQIAFDWFNVCAPQTARAHQATFPSNRDAYGPAFAQLLDLGGGMSAIDYQDALLRREAFAGKVQSLFRNCDLIICPALGIEVPTIERMSQVDDDMIVALHQFTCSFTMSRNPTITMPAGWRDSGDGPPIAVQLVAPHFHEDTLVRAGAAFQRATNWHTRHPLP
ncbi:amidase [Epibacterium ulvae]|uniref:amidase n=1 Tax=Epibacterium ulvae TaxID=1156985 RepID=UPI001BFCB9BF|nr:amidase [Epibacterium ulvae]MBT8154086.1 amidase [Epibacterium ulvae]